MKSQLAKDIHDGENKEGSQLTPQKMESLARITRGQLLEDIGESMSSLEWCEIEKFAIIKPFNLIITLMTEKPRTVDILPHDCKNSRVIMEKIRSEKITDKAAIRTLVDSYEFSSPEAKQHISDRIIDLLKMGAFNHPPMKEINLGEIDTDARL